MFSRNLASLTSVALVAHGASQGAPTSEIVQVVSVLRITA